MASSPDAAAAAAPLERVQTDLKTAMKARDAARLGTLRLLATALKNQQIESGEDLDDAGFVQVVKRLIKQRRDSATQYRDAGRDELAEKEEAEISVLEVYLPAQASEEEVRHAVEEIVAAQDLRAQGMRGMGPVMQAMSARFGAGVDNALVSRIAREALTGDG